MAASDKYASEPGTPVRNTFPEQAAMSPAVREQIAAHPYRTVIGTLSKDESRSFLKIFAIIFKRPEAARSEQDLSAFSDHRGTPRKRALDHLP
jgi:hypothetical protein